MDLIENHYLSFLKKLADNLAVRFYCPLYLVGSFTTDQVNALDVDIVMVVSDERMKRLFRSDSFNERRLRFCKKQKDYFEMHLTEWDVDFKIQTVKEFESKIGNRIKLDQHIDLESL